jgi:hypothetical protein
VVLQARKTFDKPYFMEVLVTMACWNIWLFRNGKIFQNERPTFAKWKAKFVFYISLLQCRIKAKNKDALMQWVNALP